MDNIQQSINAINKVYSHNTYFDLYSGSVIICIVLLVSLAIYYLYLKVMLKAKPIRDNWQVHRCNPKYMPFAANIVQPTNQGYFEFNGENFNYCLNNILQEIVGYFVSPIQYLISPLLTLWHMILNIMQSIRKMFAYIRIRLRSITQNIENRIVNMIPPIQIVVNKLKDMFAKTQGVFIAGIYTLIGVYDAMMSFLGSILTLIIIFLITLAVIIGILWATVWFMWWNIPIAIGATSIFVIIATILLVIEVFLLTFDVRSPLAIPTAPSRPQCFDKNTLVKTLEGSYVPINKLQLGNMLFDSSMVTSIMKCSIEGNEMFLLDDIMVTGNHYVKYNGNWMFVKDHPNSKLCDDYEEEYVFCINTTSKVISIGNQMFSDWDELYTSELVDEWISKLKGANYNNVNILSSLKPNEKCIHYYFDGGLIGETQVLMEDTTEKAINTVNIGDKLMGGKVTGIVYINGIDMTQSIFSLGEGATIRGGRNIIYYNSEENKKCSTLFNTEKNEVLTPERKLFHLILDTGKFTLSNGLVVYDYNSCLDFFE